MVITYHALRSWLQESGGVQLSQDSSYDDQPIVILGRRPKKYYIIANVAHGVAGHGKAVHVLTILWLS